MGRSPTLALRARGPLAIFTRPELKTERVSYPVMTPSAARGLLEAVLWKPAIVWRVERIKVLNEIHFTAFRRNEVNSKASLPPLKILRHGGKITSYFADDDRAQRNTVALRDVDYVVEAHFEMTPRAGNEDNVNKFVDMFVRRVEKGQHFHKPYFGCREFPAAFEMCENELPVSCYAGETRDLGFMLYDIDYARDKQPIFFRAVMVNGIIDTRLGKEGGLS